MCEAFDQAGIELSVGRINRRIGMSGGLFTNVLLREISLDIAAGSAKKRPRQMQSTTLSELRVLRGAKEFLAYSTGAGNPRPYSPCGDFGNPDSAHAPRDPT